MAYCLGQTKDPTAVPILIDVLENLQMEPIARHEAGEALGAIGDKKVSFPLNLFIYLI